MARFFRNLFSGNGWGWPVVCGLLVALSYLGWEQNRQLKEILSNEALLSGYVGNLEAETETMRPRALDSSLFSADDKPMSYSDAVQFALPSVVKIFTARVVAQKQHPLLGDPLFSQLFRNQQQQRRVERGLGSGVIVDPDGLILTNYHVIRGADRIQVMLADGRQRNAVIVGSDEATDLTVLKIDLTDLPEARFGDPGALQIGDVVLAIGNPYGIGQTVTQGIVSALGRYGLNLNTYEKYIQTDAAINEGNSGGALINARGELIGINSGLYSKSGGSTGIGFAIPIDVAKFVLGDLLAYGHVKRGWMGISVEELTPTLAEQFGLDLNKGLILTSIAAAGPAEKAGLRVGDIITHIEEASIASGNAGMHIVAQTPPGDMISVRIIRGSTAMSVAVTVSERPQPINQSRA